MDLPTQKITVGWREWVELPSFNIPAIKAKVDTGARTSALHAADIERFDRRGVSHIRFLIYPLQGRFDIIRECEAPIIDRRNITDSGGKTEWRYIIQIPIRVGKAQFESEVSLTNRAGMRYRMLLGRTALARRMIVDPARSFLRGRFSDEEIDTLYQFS